MPMKMKNVGVVAAGANACDAATALRRLNKMVKELPDMPKGAQWTVATLPKSLRIEACKIYTKHGIQANRANPLILMTQSFKMAAKKLRKKFREGKQIEGANRLDGALTLFVPFAKDNLRKKIRSGSQWEKQTNAMVGKVQDTDPNSAKNCLWKMSQQLEDELEEPTMNKYLLLVVVNLIAMIAGAFADLASFNQWYKIQGYCFPFFKKRFIQLKKAENDQDTLKELIVAAKAEKGGDDHLILKHLTSKLEAHERSLKLMDMVRDYCMQKGFSVGGALGHRPLLESPTRDKKSLSSSSKDLGVIGPLFAMPLEQVEAYINNSSKPHDAIKMIMDTLHPGGDRDKMLELEPLECAGIFKQCHEELTAANGKFLKHYALGKDKPEASVIVFGAPTVRKVALAQWNTFLHDVKSGEISSYENGLEKFADGNTLVYCGKLKCVIDSLKILEPIATYEELKEKEEAIRAMWAGFEADEVNPAVQEALNGFINSKLLKFHDLSFIKMDKLVTDGDVEKAYEVYQERMTFEESVMDFLDIRPPWRAFLQTEAGKKILEHEADEDESGEDGSGDEDESGEDDDGEEGSMDSDDSDARKAKKKVDFNLAADKKDLLDDDEDPFDMDGVKSQKATPARGMKKASSAKNTPTNNGTKKSSDNKKFNTPPGMKRASVDGNEKKVSSSMKAASQGSKQSSSAMKKMKMGKMKQSSSSMKSQSEGDGGKKMGMKRVKMSMGKAPVGAMKKGRKMNNAAVQEEVEGEDGVEGEGVVPMDVDEDDLISGEP